MTLPDKNADVSYTLDGNTPIHTTTDGSGSLSLWLTATGASSHRISITVGGEVYTGYATVSASGGVVKLEQQPLSVVSGGDYTVSNGIISKSLSDSPFTLQIAGGSGSGSQSFTAKDADGNPSDVVSVDGNGKVTLLKTGAATITVTKAAQGNYLAVSSSVTVNVGKAVIPNVISNSSSVSFDLSGVTFPDGVASASVGSDAQGSGASVYSVVEKLIGQDKSLGNLRSLVVYDLKLLDQNGNPITNFAGKVKVKIPIPSDMSGNLHVYWYNPANGTLTDMDAKQENGYLVFQTSHFSYYAIAQLQSTFSGSSSPVPNPKTGSNDWPLIPLALFGCGSMAGFAVTRKSVKHRAKKV